MQRFTLFLFAILATSSADAVTYQKLDGSIVTLQYRSDYSWMNPMYSGDHLYPGADLAPNALIDVVFNGSNLEDTLYAAFLQDADLRGVTANGSWFELIDLTGANLSNANLTACYLGAADLANADFTGANLTDAYITATTIRGSATNVNFTNANLSGSHLQAYDLSGTLFTNADLSGASLSHAYISSAQLQSAANVTGVIFTGSDQSEMDFSGLDLTNAQFNIFSWGNKTRLREADFSFSVLTGVDFSSAWLWFTDFSNADLSGSVFTDATQYNTATWTDAFYYTDNEPTWNSGMDAAWRSSVGILALAPTSAVPEPAAILLALFGLALLPRRRRR